MKRILQILLVSTALVTSCEQEEFPGSGLESLRDFTLNPVPNSKIALNSIGKSDNIVYSWEVARSGFDSPVQYTWMLDEEGGDFSSPVLSFPSDADGLTNSFTRTNDEWETLLTNLGVAAEGEFKGVWTVTATNGDVTKTAESHPLAIMRYSEAIMSFLLTGPTTGTTIFLKESKADSTIEITWESTLSGLGAPVTYEWLVDEADGDFSDPLITMSSDDEGASNKLTLTFQQLEDALAGIGVEAQSLADLQWTIKASAADAVQFADEAFDLKLVRWGTEVRLRIPALPALTPVGKDVYVAGSFSFLGLGFGDWEEPGTNDSLKLTKDTDDSYYLDINVPKGKTFEYKFVLATTGSPGYDLAEQKFNDANDACEDKPNRTLTFDGTNHVVDHTVDSWNGFCPFNVMDYVYLVGNATPANWNENTSVVMFRDSTDQLKFTYTGYLAVGEFKFLKERGQWAPMWGKESDGILKYRATSLDPDPSSISVGTAGYYTITFDASVGVYSVDAYDTTSAPIYSSIAIIGLATPNGWADPDTDMIKDPWDPHQWYIDGQALTANPLKFRADDSWTRNWGSPAFPYGKGGQEAPNIPVDADGEYLIRFCDLTGQYAIIRK